MIKIKFLFTVILFVIFQQVKAQSVIIKGTVYGTSDVEGIHVINKTLSKATTTDVNGNFNIDAVVNDTLVFSGVAYKLHTYIVKQEVVDTKLLKVFLIENVNQLSEVVVGNILTGDLSSDVKTANVKPPINFYDVGIPGYKGKIPTQSERRLQEAGDLKFSDIALGALTGAIPLNPILNAISGRTNMLKERVKLETQEELMYTIIAKHSKNLFEENPLEKELRYEFFYFCSEDPLFTKKCSANNGIKTLEFLTQKLKAYKHNLNN